MILAVRAILLFYLISKMEKKGVFLTNGESILQESMKCGGSNLGVIERMGKCKIVSLSVLGGQ